MALGIMRPALVKSYADLREGDVCCRPGVEGERSGGDAGAKETRYSNRVGCSRTRRPFLTKRSIAAVAVAIEALERQARGRHEAWARDLKPIRNQVNELSDDLHHLAYGLHPSLLEHVGLEAAVRDHVLEFKKRCGLPVSLTVRQVPSALPLEVSTALFRILQESLHNAEKHAGATEVDVTLAGSSRGIGLSIRDNGKGFEVDQVVRTAQGMGVISMQERVRLLRGSFGVRSRPGRGTQVCAWVPFGERSG